MAVIELRGKVALVTGSARRVGKAIALELARCGMHQIIHHGHSDQEAEATAAEIKTLGVEVVVIKVDFTLPEDIQRLFEAVRQHFGRLDLLVNSASTFTPDDVLSVSLQSWQEILAVNLTAPFLCSQHAARLMRETGSGGAIINILDLSALKPWKQYPAHSVSKAALLTLTETLAQNLGPDIRVNALAPGPILRDEANSPEQWERIGQQLPLGHTGDPADVAQAVAFLASQPFITGTTLRVDGGDYLR
jgi:NAD(P)-dependent dehydrogenase (short-subunit alcohol dehydrogenase family)